MIGEYRQWSDQVTATLADVLRRLEQLERRVERLDAHGGELAAEVLDVITRVDLLDEGAARRQGEHQREHDRLHRDVKGEVEAHEWRSHR